MGIFAGPSAAEVASRLGLRVGGGGAPVDPLLADAADRGFKMAKALAVSLGADGDRYDSDAARLKPGRGFFYILAPTREIAGAAAPLSALPAWLSSPGQAARWNELAIEWKALFDVAAENAIAAGNNEIQKQQQLAREYDALAKQFDRFSLSGVGTAIADQLNKALTGAIGKLLPALILIFIGLVAWRYASRATFKAR